THQALHPFPTRRSSDLKRADGAVRKPNHHQCGVFYRHLPNAQTACPGFEVACLLLFSERPLCDEAGRQRRYFGNSANEKLGEVRSEEHTSELQSRENLV